MSLTDLEMIQKLDFFELLDKKTVRAIAQQCFERSFNSGDVIIRQGEPGLGLYFIASGRVRVEIETSGTHTVIADLGAGDCVGEFAIVDEKSRSATVTCTEKVSCLLLTRDSFSKLMNKYPQIAILMVQALVARLRATNSRVIQSAPVKPAAPSPAPRPKIESHTENGMVSLFSLPVQMFQSYASAKGELRDILVDALTPIYAARAMTRFSMAVIGCPVTIHPVGLEYRPVPGMSADRIKVCVFPSDRHQVLGIDAYAEGEVSVTVLRPAASTHLRGTIRENDRWRLHIPPGREAPCGPVRMEVQDGETIGFEYRR